MSRKYSKLKWCNLIGKEESQFSLLFEFSLNQKITSGVLLDDFLKRMQLIQEDDKRIVSVEMEMNNIIKKRTEVIYKLDIQGYFEGECTEEWMIDEVINSLKQSLVSFNWYCLKAN